MSSEFRKEINQKRAHKDHLCPRFQETQGRNDGQRDACFVEMQRNWGIKLNPNRPMGEKKKSSPKRKFYNIEVKMPCQEVFARISKAFPTQTLKMW
jgi:hypothetical protein